MKSLPSSSTYAVWLGVFRIATGVLWVAHALPKFTHSETFMPPTGFVTNYIQNGLPATTGFYHDFLANIVQPNLMLFAELVRFGELLTGIALVIGSWTRLGGLVGIFLPLNYLAARGHLLSNATLQSVDFTLLVLSAISLVLPTGRALGIDALLARRTRRATSSVRAEFVPEPPLDKPTAPPNP